MSIFHDTYLFKPDTFSSTVLPYVEALQSSKKGYNELRSAAIRAYDTNPQVRALSEEYGGWDRNAIITQIPEDYPISSEDTAFWFVLLLYSHLFKKDSYPSGFGNAWKLMETIVSTLDWSEQDRKLLIYGHSFKHFALKEFYKTEAAFMNEEKLEYWDFIHPFSTAGCAGWIDYNTAKGLIERLTHDRSHLSQLAVQQYIKADDEIVYKVFQLAIDMLMITQIEKSGLCIIISG